MRPSLYLVSFVRSDPLFALFRVFFFTAPATSEIYTLSLHDALPISRRLRRPRIARRGHAVLRVAHRHRVGAARGDRKSTRLNSSHRCISYAVFCLKKKNKKQKRREPTKKTVARKISTHKRIR